MAPAIALTIAGSDSSGGAGIQADLKSFSALGVYGASVITAITAQNTHGVEAIEPVSPAMISAQIDAAFSDLDISAIKIGMVGGVEAIEAVAARLRHHLAARSTPIVLDPVMIAKSGDVLLPSEAISALRENLLPLASLLTPNLPEAADLLGIQQAKTHDELRNQGQALLALGPRHVLLKGGHAAGKTCTDLLLGEDEMALCAPRIHTKNTHGTGCSLSSAIAAGLASGMSMTKAIRQAHDWLHCAILAADDLNVGSGHGPVHHFHAMWSKA
ncbi:bifunctional hydroxymethylpyrimidine kinase/phosphomethylpyrimidine kinase [Aquamicrobium segne]|uniref:hydroxymethylpyrimidine kinase n=1 Tax=Aquamicrobium segne TaxID=469547 RepID=A0ABW0GU13_9HYPH